MIRDIDVKSKIVVEKLSDLKYLKRFMEVNNMKVNKSAIARDLNVDRRTVEKYMDGYVTQETRKRVSQFDQYSDVIEELLSETNIQQFFYKRVLWQYLVDNHGLTGAQSSFRRYISQNAKFDAYFKNRSFNTTTTSTSMRFETEPGEQAQLDWKESMAFTTSDGIELTINVFALVLSFSRFKVFRLSLTKDRSVLISFIVDAFECFGGVPKQMLTDNMKTVMDEARTQYKKGKVNAEFAQFASDFGFEVFPCIAGRPNTKAKVEAPMKLLDEILAYNGRLTYEELNELVIRINERENAKLHPSTGRIPILHLKKEKDFLKALPHATIRNPYKFTNATVKVNQSSMITYKRNQYSVPMQYIGKRLTIQFYANLIHVYFNKKLVTIHDISTNNLNYHEKHYIEVTTSTIRKEHNDITNIAKENLKAIGDLYENE